MKELFFINYEKKSMNHFITSITKCYKKELALTYDNGQGFSYEQLLKAIYKVHSFLNELKIPKNGKVALLSENSPWWGALYFSVVASGRVVVPILPDFMPLDVENILKISSCDAVFVSTNLYSRNTHLSKAKIPVILTEGAVLIKKGEKSAAGMAKSFDDFNANLEKLDFDEVYDYFEKFDIKEDELCSLIYTSGTTGTSKGVMLSHSNLISNVISARVIPPHPSLITKGQNSTISILPLAHTYECTIGLLVTLDRGCHMHYLSKPLSPSALIPCLQKIRPGIMLSVPILIEKIYNKSIVPKFTGNKFMKKIYSIRFFAKILNRIAGKKLYKMFGGNLVFFGIGGAGLAPDVEKFLLDGKFPYAMGYGLTETSPLVAGFNASEQRYRSTGHFIDNVKLRIDKSDPDAIDGEIQVKGPNVMLGYYKDKAKTAEVFTPDGWFRTGDLGRIVDNFLYISGRLKSVILGPSGENIYPESIEAMLNEFEFVEDSLVMENEGKGLVAMIFFNKKDMNRKFEQIKDSMVDFQTNLSDYIKKIKDDVNKRLSNYSKISHIEDRDEPFEKTPTLKIKRYLYNPKSLKKIDDKKERK